jgi:hypothetical protein
MPSSKLKHTKRRTKVKDLPKREKVLTKEDQKKVRGGLLPYIEQDNLRQKTNITDGSSNTVKQ